MLGGRAATTLLLLAACEILCGCGALPRDPPPPPVPTNWTPAWKPNWNLTESTVIEPSYPAGYFSPNHTFGLVSLDFSTASSIWFANGANASNATATSVEGCRRLKASGRAARCFVYMNLELALQWEERQRAVMYDPARKDFFLLRPNGSIYNDPDLASRGLPAMGDQFFWNHSNPAAQECFIDIAMATVQDPAVDGLFTDDVAGVPQEHASAVKNLGLSGAALLALQAATTATHTRLVTQLIAAGKFNWQAFPDEAADDQTSGGISKKNCVKFMREHCDPSMQARPLLMSAGSPGRGKGPCWGPSICPETVAAFLIVRPPIGFLGYGWESDDRMCESGMPNLSDSAAAVRTVNQPSKLTPILSTAIVPHDCHSLVLQGMTSSCCSLASPKGCAKRGRRGSSLASGAPGPHR